MCGIRSINGSDEDSVDLIYAGFKAKAKYLIGWRRRIEQLSLRP